MILIGCFFSDFLSFYIFDIIGIYQICHAERAASTYFKILRMTLVPSYHKVFTKKKLFFG